MQCPLCGGDLELRVCPLCGAETLPAALSAVDAAAASRVRSCPLIWPTGFSAPMAPVSVSLMTRESAASAVSPIRLSLEAEKSHG